MSAPGWLVAEVAEGMQRLMVLRLDGTPPADAIDGVVLAWADALMVRGGGWNATQDAPRIREAFRRLAAHVVRWPAPAEIFLHLPDRAPVQALPPPPITDDQRAHVRAMLAAIRAKLERTK